MLLSILELMITLGCILEQDRLHVTGTNIMLGKPSRQSSTFSGRYPSSNANDGRDGDAAITKKQLDPFWQGDLQGFYTVHNITITKARNKNNEIANASIGVSSVDVDCRNDNVILCGQWPTFTHESGLTFNCSHELPVRFVRVWRNVLGPMNLQEVEVEGTLRTLNAATYDKSLNTKLAPNVTSVNALSANECASKCLVTQPCLAFSYNSSVQLPCILATTTATTTATGWVTYTISTCSKDTACD